MELIKEDITYGVGSRRLMTQLTFDDDINVSDSNADIRSIIMQTGHVRLEEMRVLGGRIRLAGHLEFSVLYTSEDRGILSCIRGDFAFEEMVNYDQGRDGEQVTVLWDMEDLRAQVINSRKMNVKACVILAIQGLLPLCIYIYLLNSFIDWHILVFTPCIVMYFIYLLIWKRLHGYTGDCCGAMFLLVELSFYLTAASML